MCEALSCVSTYWVVGSAVHSKWWLSFTCTFWSPASAEWHLPVVTPSPLILYKPPLPSSSSPPSLSSKPKSWDGSCLGPARDFAGYCFSPALKLIISSGSQVPRLWTVCSLEDVSPTETHLSSWEEFSPHCFNSPAELSGSYVVSKWLPGDALSSQYLALWAPFLPHSASASMCEPWSCSLPGMCEKGRQPAGGGGWWDCMPLWSFTKVRGDRRTADSITSASERLLAIWNKPCWDISLRPQQGEEKDPDRSRPITFWDHLLGPVF